MARICLLVGNGFSIDLIKNLKLDVDSSYPLRSFNSPNINFDEFINKLPLVKDELLPIIKDEVNDFTAISKYIEDGKLKGEEEFIARECHLRRFLALAYSKLQVEVEKYNYSNWSWVKWLYKHRKNIVCLISFNYDLILEKAFRMANVKNTYRRVGVFNEKAGIPVIKPHGSIDFEIPDGLIGFGNEEDIWSSILSRNQYSIGGQGVIKSVPYYEWFKPRLQPDIIPPSQINYHKELGWVQDCFKTYSNVAKNGGVDTFVIVGHSYAEVDRDEINDFISCLDRKSNFYIVNPDYESDGIQELIKYIETKGHQVVGIQKFGPPKDIKEVRFKTFTAF